MSIYFGIHDQKSGMAWLTQTCPIAQMLIYKHLPCICELVQEMDITGKVNVYIVLILQQYFAATIRKYYRQFSMDTMIACSQIYTTYQI